jgi:hypothetical protein
MALQTGTQITVGTNGLRENLTDVIYDISPEDTPLSSNIGRETDITSTLHEWQTDALQPKNTANAVVQGDRIGNFPTVTSTVRVGNYTQISRALVSVSGTLRKAKAAGRKDEYAYQLSKRGVELKIDIEAISLINQGGVAAGVTTAPLTATLGAWVKSNVDKEATGGNPAYTSGVPSAPRTDATTTLIRTFSETILKNVALAMYNNGAKLRMLMLSPDVLVTASAFAGIASNVYQINAPKSAAIIGSANVYVSPFGVLHYVANRHQRSRDAWFIDPEFIALGFYRSFETEKLAKLGDSDDTMLLAEWLLKVKNEKALGLAADIKA